MAASSNVPPLAALPRVFSDDNATVEVTLRSLDSLDDFKERKVLLSPNSSVPVGRSSRNPAKGLMASSNNLFIDSPVISRNHASLTLDCSLNGSIVYLTDNSMHGTWVNGNLLPRGQDHKLSSGDKLQFGANVIRDQNSFIAKRFIFTSNPAPPPAYPTEHTFSLGFSVPDEVPSEDDVSPSQPNLKSSPYPPSYGSQSNPVNVDDFEDRSSPLIIYENEHTEHGLIRPISTMTKENLQSLQDQALDCPPSPFLRYPYGSEAPRGPGTSSGAGPVSIDVQVDSSDEDDESIDAHDEDNVSINTSDADSEEANQLSEDESIGNSDVESINVSEESNSDVGAVDNNDAPQSSKYPALLNYEEQEMDGNGPAHTQTSVTLAQISSPFQSSPTTSTWLPSLVDPAFGAPAKSKSSTQETSMHEAKNSGILPMSPDSHGGNVWDRTCAGHSSAPKPNPWSSTVPRGIDYTNTVEARMREPINHDMMFFPHQPMFGAGTSDPGYVMDISQAPVNNPWHRSVDTAVTPILFTPPMPHSEDPIPTSSPPNPRTKMSIAEIVEEAPPQPPTPTSASGSPNLKRKADVFDDDDDDERDEALLRVDSPEEHSEEKPKMETMSVVVEPPPQPPRKKSKSAIGYVASGMAAGVILGGSAVLSALMYLPPSIFE